MNNITIFDNGAAYLIRVNGLTVAYFSTLGEAWEHIRWMYRIETQEFTVGQNKIEVKEWINMMIKLGFMEPIK